MDINAAVISASQGLIKLFAWGTTCQAWFAEHNVARIAIPRDRVAMELAR